MVKKLVTRVLTPLLFIVATSLCTLAATDLAILHRKIISTSDKSDSYLISKYDNIFQKVGERYGLDWLFLSAIAYSESEFKPTAISKVGAIGIMQIMPSVAKNMGYEREALFDVEVCAEVAAKLLHENNKMLRLSNSFDKKERLRFILACYNAGYSRIADARRLANFHNEDSNDWSIVATYLEKLAEPEFYNHEVVVSGDFYGSKETITYVKKVMRIYNRYRNTYHLSTLTTP